MSKELNKEPAEQAGGDERVVDGKPRATKCPDCGEGDLMPGDLCACGYETDPAAGYACSECDGSGEGCVGEVCRECDGSGWFVTPEQARAALAQPSPAQAEQEEAERPEVVGYLATAEHPKHGQPHKAFNYFKDQHDAQVAHWRERGCTVTEDRLMTVSQHERIVGALRSEIAEWQEAAGRSRSDVVAYIAERAKLLEERDAAQARVAGLEAELETERMRLAACGTAALGYFDGCADAYKSASLSDVLRLRGDCDAALARVAEFEAQAQHSVPVVTPEMVMAAMAVFRLDVSPFKSMEAALIAALRKAAAPGKEVGHE